MAIEIIMPKFGLSMEEGTVGVWLVQQGDAVKEGDPIAEISSEKLTNNAVAPQDGILAKILLKEGESAACGTPIAILLEAGETAKELAETQPAAEPPAVQAAEQIVAAAAPFAAEKPADGEIKITPRAKKIAEEKRLTYTHIRGTGLHGFITIDDLKREGKPEEETILPSAAEQPIAAASVPSKVPTVLKKDVQKPGAVQRLSPMQAVVASRMQQSLQEAAQTTMVAEVNVQPLTEVYELLKSKYKAAGVKLSYTAMLIKSVAQALENQPKIRVRRVDAGHFTVLEQIDIGVAVDLPDGGLMVPVIRGANLKDLRTICIELADLAQRSRSGQLAEVEMGNAAITVTNLGMFGISSFTPILNPPEACILGTGAIVKKPVVRDGGIFSEAVMHLSLTHDHCLVNGGTAARFLQEVVAGLIDFRWV